MTSYFSDDTVLAGSASLSVDQASGLTDVNGVIWDSARVVAHMLEHQVSSPNCSFLSQPRKALELGAGTGYVSLVLGALGIQSVATDLPSKLDLVQHNIDKNSAVLRSRVSAVPLNWGDEEDVEKLLSQYGTDFDTVLVNDCVYYEEGALKLIDTLCILAQKLNNPQFVFSFEERDEHATLILRCLKMLKDRGFDWKGVNTEFMHPEWRADDIHVMIMHRK